MIRPGYHAGWLWQYDFETVVTELAHLGFRDIAFRASRANLDPRRDDFADTLARLGGLAEQFDLGIVLDLDGDFLLDPFIAESRISPAADDEAKWQAAIDWLARWHAAASRVDRVSLLTVASGIASRAGGDDEFRLPSSSADADRMPRRLAEALGRVFETTNGTVPLALRPRVGDVLGSVSRWMQWSPWLADANPSWSLAADVGEMIAAAEIPIVDRLLACRNLGCVFLCDRDPGIRGDVRFGTGQVSTASIVTALRRGGWSGPVIYRYSGGASAGGAGGAEGLGPARVAMADFENA
ncbi:MAG: TIM barrel protein [Planctomycetota bacterium]